MARTTLDIDTPVLEELKRMQKRQGKTLGRLVSDLLARALSDRASRTSEPAPIQWISKDMKPRVDVDEKDALWRALDEGES